MRTRPRIVEALRPPKIETPPEALVAPPPLIVAEADLPTALDDGPTPASSAGEKRKPRKKVAAAAPPPMLDLPALPLLDAPPKAEPAAGDQPKSVASAELPALPSLDLPLLPLEPSKKEKKAKKVAMAPAIPDLPGLDLPLPAAAPSASKAARLATLGESRIETARPIAFQGNSARLANDGRKVLDDVARVLFTNPELRIEIAGHADSDANGGLAQARAAAVAAYLRAKGIDADRLAVESFGASQPLLAGVTKSARKKNLRVELNVLKR